MRTEWGWARGRIEKGKCQVEMAFQEKFEESRERKRLCYPHHLLLLTKHALCTRRCAKRWNRHQLI